MSSPKSMQEILNDMFAGFYANFGDTPTEIILPAKLFAQAESECRWNYRDDMVPRVPNVLEMYVRGNRKITIRKQVCKECGK